MSPTHTGKGTKMGAFGSDGTVLLLLALLCVIGLLTLAAWAIGEALRALRTREMRRSLQGDWWPRFERELRAYERRCSRVRHRGAG